jgi:hypothetical protein
MLTPHLIKSCNKPLASSPSWGSAPSISTLEAPCDAPSTPDITRADSSYASDVSSTNVRDSTGSTADRGWAQGDHNYVARTHSRRHHQGWTRECHRACRMLTNDRDRRGATPATPTPLLKVRTETGEAGAA